MKFNDLKAEYNYFEPYIKAEWDKVLASGHYLFGPQVQALEANMCRLTGRSHALAVKNCTDAITMIIRLHWRPGMPVILPNFGAYPTAMAVLAAGVPVHNMHFIDVDDTFCIDPVKLEQLAVDNGIVIAVDLFGNNCDLPAIKYYCSTNNHLLIADMAQATGNSNTKSKLPNYQVFSFYPTKPLAAMGDGGIITTNYMPHAAALQKMRFYGIDQHNPGPIQSLGINSRMDEWQAAVVNAKMQAFINFDDLTKLRQKIARRYNKIVKGMRATGNCVYHQYPVLFNERDAVIMPELKKRGIPFMIHYPHHISDMPVFQMAPAPQLIGNRIANKIISLPCNPFLLPSEIETVEQFLTDFKSYEA